ncbi:hypothetical protein C0991_005155, partial [Blastosporella zonata]
MPPPTWATPAQLKFLKNHLPAYIDLKADRKSKHSNRKMTDFINQVTKEFHISWMEVECLVVSNQLPESALTSDELTWTAEAVALVKKVGDGRRDQIKWWFCNNAKTVLGTQGMQRQSNVVLASLVKPQRKCRIHKVIEKYQMMYRDKIRDLMKPKLLKYHKKYGTASVDVLETQIAEVDWDSEDKEGDQNGDEGEKEVEGLDETERRKQIKTSKHFKLWVLKTRKAVAEQEWQTESQDVKDEVLKAIELEKVEMLVMLDTEKEGLERDAKQRQFVSYGKTVATSESFIKWYKQYKENVNEKFLMWLFEVYSGTTVPDKAAEVDNDKSSAPDIEWSGPYGDDFNVFDNTSADLIMPEMDIDDDSNIDPALLGK